jgi:hypothetical protein
VNAADEVEVFVLYERTWVPGYDVAEISTNGDGDETYVLRRRSDGQQLPGTFPATHVRPGARQPHSGS